jgi:hypothetical protein
MEYVDGSRLTQCWPSLPWWSKLRVAFTLRRYVNQLRKLRNPNPDRPGPLGETPGFCDGVMFYNSTRGPFIDSASLSAFFQRMLGYARHVPCPYGAHPQTSDYRGNPLVFTHNDLNMDNIIMGPDGTLWLIDFAFSGFYPRHFEYIAMECAAKYAKPAPGKFFTALIPFITDPYFEERLWLNEVASTMTRSR